MIATEDARLMSRFVRRSHRAGWFTWLVGLLWCVACARPAPATVPTPASAVGQVAATASPMLATQERTTPTAEVTLAPTRSVSVTPTVSPTPEPTVGLSVEQVMALPTPRAEAACGQAHAATVTESVDLHHPGRLLAPPLETFNQYRLDLVLDRETATVSGTQTLIFTNRTSEMLADLLFHLYPNLPDFGGNLAVGCAAVNGSRIEPLFEDDRWIMRLPLQTPLAPRSSVDVTLHFQTTSLRDEAAGYGAFSLADDLWTLASFYPLLAIRVDGEWDTLRPNGWGDFVTSDASLYHVQLTFPLNHRVVASGEGGSSCDGAACTATVAAGPHRDFTMALVTGWEQARRTVGDSVIVSSFPPGQRDPGERALELAADAMMRFSAAFGPYPYTEMDILPIRADGFAAVEYSGMIMIGDQYYLDPDHSGLELEDVVVHEAAHMWWYAVVGNDVLRDPWLDEGLTSYSGEYLYTEWSGRGARPVTRSRQAQLESAGLGDEPIDLAVAEYDDAGEYVGVAYGRAPLFLDALRQELGDDVFFKLLQEHYRRNAFSRATTESFKLLAEEIAGRHLDAFGQEWFSARAQWERR